MSVAIAERIRTWFRSIFTRAREAAVGAPKRVFVTLSEERTFRFFGSVIGILAVAASIFAAWLQVSAINRQTALSLQENAKAAKMALSIRCDPHELAYDPTGPRYNVFLIDASYGIAGGEFRPSSPIGPTDYPIFEKGVAYYGYRYFYPRIVETCSIVNAGISTVEDATIYFDVKLDHRAVDPRSEPLALGPLPPILSGASYTVTIAGTELFNVYIVPRGAAGRVIDGPMTPADFDIQGDQFIMIAGLEPLDRKWAQRWAPDERCVGTSRTC